MYMNLYTSEMVSKYQRYCYTYSNHSASTFRSKPPVFHQVSIDRTIFENTCIVQLSLDHDATRLALPGNEYRSSCSAVQQLFLPSSPAHLVYTRVYASTSSTFNSKRIRDSKTCACLLYVYPCVVLEWTRKGCRFTPHHLHSLPLPISLSLARPLGTTRERERDDNLIAQPRIRFFSRRSYIYILFLGSSLSSLTLYLRINIINRILIVLEIQRNSINTTDRFVN